MKKLLFLTALFIGSVAFSQTTYNPKLLLKFDRSYLESQVTNNPHFIKRQNYIVENSYTIIDEIDIPQNVDVKELQVFDNKNKVYINSEINNSDLDDFNIYKYKTQPGEKTDSYYKIGNTGKVLVVFSMQKQAQLYNQYRNLN